MKKLVLTVIGGIVIGQIVCMGVALLPGVVPDMESFVAMLFASPLIALATIYSPLVYEKIKQR